MDEVVHLPPVRSGVTRCRARRIHATEFRSQMKGANKSLQRTAGFRFSQFLALWPAAAEFTRYAMKCLCGELT